MILLALAVVLVLDGPAGPAAPAYAATADQPTISFVGGGPAPLACSSRPDVPNMTIKKNTWIVLVNLTGADATAAVGADRSVEVADGAAISVRLKEGTYAVTMTPKCLQTYGVQATEITVVKAAPSEPSGLPDPSKVAGPSPAEPAGFSGAAATSGSVGSSGSSGSSALSGDSSGPGAVDPDVSDPELAGGPEVEAAVTVRPGDRSDVRGARLLALIAAICVFGVTSAIIRAIVAQRATGALGTRSGSRSPTM